MQTKKTPKPGDRKPTNLDLQRTMISLSNNSRMTTEAAHMLTQKLDMPEMSRLLEWMRHASRQQSNKNNNRPRF